MNQASPIITLTTDFGYKDPFIAEMKGVIFSINPNVSIVDVTHDIEPFNIDEAAFVIGSSYKYFPPGTIHVVVIDPGVGSERRPVIMKGDGNLFVGPDNGVFSRILQGVRSTECVEITNDKYVIQKMSPTFQGRDVFAPAAAWLSLGVGLPEFGLRLLMPTTIRLPGPQMTERGLEGKVLYIDRFGNAITNITENDLALVGRDYRIDFKGHPVIPAAYYSQAAAGSLNSLINSSGYLEIFSYRAEAARIFGINKGDVISISKR